ncbi:MAG: CPBP family intramembrane metalloprotease [Opitutales bacterium]|nr:CPBP family intramembrane metalloprotease [Opitutales bacterium]
MAGRDERFLLFGTPPDRFDWHGVGWFALLFAAAFAVGAVVAPPLYAGVIWLGAGAEAGTLLHYLAGKQLDVYVDRVRLLFALGATLWLIGYCRLWGRFGFVWDRRGAVEFMCWFGVGAAMLAAMTGLQWIFLGPEWAAGAGPDRLARTVTGALATALAVGFLEEAIFRGMVFRMFYTAVRPAAAVVLSALVFAAVHFKGVSFDPEAELQWWSGFAVAWQSFLAVVYTFEFFPFVNLFLAGVALNLLFVRTGGLMACVGLHAGWVVVRQTWAKSVSLESEAGVFWLGGRGVVDGVVPVFILCVLIGGLWYGFYRRNVESAGG